MLYMWLNYLEEFRFNKMFVNTLGAPWEENALSTYFILGKKQKPRETDAHILKLLWNIRRKCWITVLFSVL